MVDKIHGWSTSQPRRTEGPARSDAASRAGSTGSSTASKETSESAPAARTTLLEQARARADAAPVVDQAKVDAIKGAISRGEFKIDATAVAKAFVAMESGLRGA